MKKTNFYEGWELKYFDKSNNFRNYQYEIFKNYIKGYVAEIGPGNGKNLSKYKILCKRIALYEPSFQLYQKLVNKYNKNKNIEIINKIFPKYRNKFDTIIYFDVLEHIKKDKDEVTKAFKALKKDGHLIINVPAFAFLYSQFDRDVGHYRRYIKKDFNNIFKGTPCKSMRMKYYDSIGFVLSLFSKVLTSNYRKNFKKKIFVWNKLIPLSKILDKLILFKFGKSLSVIIKK